MFTERKQIINPDELRRAQHAILKGVRNKILPPSSFIEILEKEQDERIRDAMLNAYNRYVPSDYKDKVNKVKDALDVLKEFDKP